VNRPKDVAARVQNQCQSVRVPIASPVKVTRIETVAAGASQKRKAFALEFRKDIWKV
jgi:hypothetical protein